MVEDEEQAAAQAANPNVMNANELKTLFSDPKADIPIFYGGTIPRTQSRQNLCLVESKLPKQLTTGQTQLQPVISNWPLKEKLFTG
jgi:hypothetical protein